MQSENQQQEQYFNRRQAADYTGFAYGTLKVWDSTKRYDLQPSKVGRNVRYKRSVLDKLMTGQISPNF